MSKVKYPDVVVALTSIDGNAFSVMGATQRAMKRAGISKEECDQYFSEATQGDYHHLISTTMKWVSVE